MGALRDVPVALSWHSYCQRGGTQVGGCIEGCACWLGALHALAVRRSSWGQCQLLAYNMENQARLNMHSITGGYVRARDPGLWLDGDLRCLVHWPARRCGASERSYCCVNFRS